MNSNKQQAWTFAHGKREFDEAWNDERHTRFELPPVDVNRVLRERYTVEPANATMTLTNLWGMEKKKAWDPATYI